jgi:hypothetical protein
LAVAIYGLLIYTIFGLGKDFIQISIEIFTLHPITLSKFSFLQTFVSKIGPNTFKNKIFLGKISLADNDTNILYFLGRIISETDDNSELSINKLFFL